MQDLSLRPGTESVPHAVEAQNPNHWPPGNSLKILHLSQSWQNFSFKTFIINKWWIKSSFLLCITILATEKNIKLKNSRSTFILWGLDSFNKLFLFKVITLLFFNMFWNVCTYIGNFILIKIISPLYYRLSLSLF